MIRHAIVIILCLGVIPVAAAAEDASGSADLDLLVAPTSPAFILMDVAPEAVERPADLADFSLSLQNASDDFNNLPANYAVEFAPYWLLGGTGLTYDAYAAGRRPLWRTLSVSLGTTTATDSVGIRSRSLGAGLRLSLIQGRIDTAYRNYGAILDSLRRELDPLALKAAAMANVSVDSDSVCRHFASQEKALWDQRDTLIRGGAAPDNPMVAVLDSTIELVSALQGTRMEQLRVEAMARLRREKEAEIATVQRQARSLEIRRLGFNLDLAGGAAWSFPGEEWKLGKLHKGGAWLTATYQGRKLAALAVGRYLRDELLGLNTVDVGVRVLADHKRFTVSGEAVHRSSSEQAIVDDSWRYDLAVAYRYARNKSVSLTFGKDFDGSPNGNVLALLNLVFGFGTERPTP